MPVASPPSIVGGGGVAERVSGPVRIVSPGVFISADAAAPVPAVPFRPLSLSAGDSVVGSAESGAGGRAAAARCAAVRGAAVDGGRPRADGAAVWPPGSCAPDVGDVAGWPSGSDEAPDCPDVGGTPVGAG